ncbi:MAG TPA: SRPBCC domain-containing protein [Xanthobacteraceae bacterium]|nr:SRPBCC domain-containing protein [Xanthobacteraceae bacterium]
MTAATRTKFFAERELAIARVFDAPRERVFKAWTDPKELAEWWGPKGFTNPVCGVEAWTGGALHIVMRAPDGTDYPMQGVFQKVAPPSLLVFTNIAVDKGGNHLLEGLTTVVFEDMGGKTKLTLHTRAIALVDYAAAYLAGMDAGWTQSIDKLQALMAAR